MAKILNFGYTAAEKTVNVPRPVLVEHDYSVLDDDNGKCIVTNLTAPVDQPETLRWASTTINNIYSNSGVDPSHYGTSKRGISFVAELKEVASVTDDSDPSYRVDLPISVHTVVKCPTSALLSSDNILELLERNLSLMFNGESTTSSRVSELLHGAMKPSTM